MNGAFSRENELMWQSNQNRINSMIREEPGRGVDSSQNETLCWKQSSTICEATFSSQKKHPQSGQLPIAAGCFSLYQLHFITLTKIVPVILICSGEKNNTGQWNTFHSFDTGNKDKALSRWQIKASRQKFLQGSVLRGATDTIVKNCDVTSQ